MKKYVVCVITLCSVLLAPPLTEAQQNSGEGYICSPTGPNFSDCAWNAEEQSCVLSPPMDNVGGNAVEGCVYITGLQSSGVYCIDNPGTTCNGNGNAQNCTYYTGSCEGDSTSCHCDHGSDGVATQIDCCDSSS